MRHAAAGAWLTLRLSCPGISKASTGINVVLMFIALWGMIASTRADYLWVAAHSALVFGLVFIFVIYILLSIAFGKYVGRFRLTCRRWLVAGCLTNPPL